MAVSTSYTWNDTAATNEMKNDNPDDDRFFKVEKEIWTVMYPHCTNELEDELEEASDEEGDSDSSEEEEDKVIELGASSSSYDGSSSDDSSSSGDA